MVEVYNEAIYDLLVAPNEVHTKLQILKKGKDVVVPVSKITCLTFYRCSPPAHSLLIIRG